MNAEPRLRVPIVLRGITRITARENPSANAFVDAGVQPIATALSVRELFSESKSKKRDSTTRPRKYDADQLPIGVAMGREVRMNARGIPALLLPSIRPSSPGPQEEFAADQPTLTPW